MKRRTHSDGRWSMIFIIFWLIVCIVMLVRSRLVFGPPHL